eukprot:7390602-Prymnesium_polylepis.1
MLGRGWVGSAWRPYAVGFRGVLSTVRKRQLETQLPLLEDLWVPRKELYTARPNETTKPR